MLTLFEHNSVRPFYSGQWPSRSRQDHSKIFDKEKFCKLGLIEVLSRSAKIKVSAKWRPLLSVKCLCFANVFVWIKQTVLNKQRFRHAECERPQAVPPVFTFVRCWNKRQNDSKCGRYFPMVGSVPLHSSVWTFSYSPQCTVALWDVQISRFLLLLAKTQLWTVCQKLARLGILQLFQFSLTYLCSRQIKILRFTPNAETIVSPSH